MLSKLQSRRTGAADSAAVQQEPRDSLNGSYLVEISPKSHQY
jgi:hypothetical protein